MATTPDPLLLLRQSITAGKPFVPSTSGDASAAADDSTPLSKASHLQFPSSDGSGVALSLDAPTRFNTADDRAVDLRSIYFAWLNRELAIPEYNAAATTLNAELTGGAKVQNLGFIERLDLITWLEGASDDSEYIKPLAGDADSAAVAAASAAAGVAASGVASKTGAAAAVTQARSGKGTMDPRLQSVYNGERRMGDRNTVLRGIKPTVCEAAYLVARGHHSLTYTGLFACAQAGRTIHQEIFIIGSHQQSATGDTAETVRQETRPHHPTVAIRLLNPPHVQRPLFSGRRQVRPSRCWSINSQHASRSAHDSRHRPYKATTFHSCRGSRTIQTRVLEPRCSGLHDRSDLAVQELQVEQPGRAVQARSWSFRGLER